MNKLMNKAVLKIVFVLVVLTMLTVTGCKKEKVTTTSTNEDINKQTTDSASNNTNEDSDTIEEPTDTPEETEEAEEEAQPDEPEVVVDEHEGEAINNLTGLWISEEVASRRPIGIMINNLKAAMPQSGVAQADVIYETLVEGGITRLFAIYKDFDAEKIGPVRSARHYYLDFAFDHDAIYTHYGQSTYAKAKFKEWNSANLNGLSYLDAIMCYQDTSRKRPHSTYTSFDKLIKAWETVGYRETSKDDFESKFKFSEEEIDPNSELKATLIRLPYSSSYSQKPWFEYNEEAKLYYRFQFGDKHIDRETGEQLTFKNIIIQFTNIWPIKGDKLGCMDMSLISSGDGYFITNGKAEKITWKKTSHYKPTLYYNEDGEEIKLNKGKSWVSVFPTNRKSKITFE